MYITSTLQTLLGVFTVFIRTNTAFYNVHVHVDCRLYQISPTLKTKEFYLHLCRSVSQRQMVP